MSLFVMSCQENVCDSFLNEIQGLGLSIQHVKWLERGTGVLSVDSTFSELAQKVKSTGLIFARHMFPVDYQFTVEKDIFANEALQQAAADLAQRLDSGKSFTVQVRVLDEEAASYAYNRHDITHFIADALKAQHFCLCVEKPCQVISVVLSGSEFYMGLSYADENISTWAGGMRRYQREDDRISRAEFKLEEAIEFFQLDLSGCKRALDLGAAPGGWTKVLTSYGLQVVAVDPAELDSRLHRNPNITHYAGLAQEYIKNADSQFDVMVNDMRMDVTESVKIMLALSGSLKSGGKMIMTFKLPKKKPMASIKKGLLMLEREFIHVRAKQLFHNRSEITVMATRYNR